MRPRLFLLLVAVPTLVVLAVGSLPARVLTLLTDGEQLRLSGLSGTALRGRAARAMVATPAGYFHLGELRWRLDFWSLLTLAPALELDSEWGTQRVSLQLGLSGSRRSIRNLDASLDAAIVQQAVPLSVAGRLQMLFDTIEIDGSDILSARGRLVWQDAGWQSLAGFRPLGSYVAVFDTPRAGTIDAAIETLSGAVAVDGSVMLAGQRYSIDLQVAASRGTLDAELSRALSLVATQEENGYRLRLDGELSPVQ